MVITPIDAIFNENKVFRFNNYICFNHLISLVVQLVCHAVKREHHNIAYQFSHTRALS